jgi:hypothetical protein
MGDVTDELPSKGFYRRDSGSRSGVRQRTDARADAVGGAMAEQILTILEAHAGGAKAPTERMLEIVHAFLRQADLRSSTFPRRGCMRAGFVATPRRIQHRDIGKSRHQA